MSVISEDLMIASKHKSKGFSKDFIQRYLNSFSDFIKADLSAEMQGFDFTCQEFSVWKFLLINLDRKNSDALSVVFAFILHLNSLLNNLNFNSKKQECRITVLVHFILSSFASTLNLQNICDSLTLLRSRIDQQFWSMLPNPGLREPMVTYIQKLEMITEEINDYPEQVMV